MYHKLIMTGFLVFFSAGQAYAWVARPSVLTELRYESNPDPGSQTARSGDEYILSVSPQIELESQGVNTTLNARYRFTGNHYLEDHSRDWVAHNASAWMDMSISPLTEIRAEYDFTYTREPREASLTGIESFRTGIQSHRLLLNGSRMFTPKLTASLTLGEDVLEFNDPSAVDSRTDSAGVSGELRITERSSLTSGYDFTNLLFDSSPDIQSHSVTAGFVTRHSPTLTYNMSAGLTYSDGLSDRLDWTAAAGLTKSFQKTSVAASYSRSVSDSSGLADLLNINDTVSVGLTRSLSAATVFSLTSGYSMNRSRPAGRVDLRSYSAGTSLQWRALRWATVGAGLSHFNQFSDGETGSDVERNIIYLNLTLHHESRI